MCQAKRASRTSSRHSRASMISPRRRADGEQRLDGGRRSAGAALRERKLRTTRCRWSKSSGLNLVQGTPTAQYIAQRCALWPSTPEAQYRAGAVFAAAQDARAARLVTHSTATSTAPAGRAVVAARSSGAARPCSGRRCSPSKSFSPATRCRRSPTSPAYELLDFAHAACSRASGLERPASPSAPSPAFEPRARRLPAPARAARRGPRARPCEAVWSRSSGPRSS